MGYRTTWDTGLNEKDYVEYRTMRYRVKIYGIQDYMGYRTTCYKGLNGVQDYIGYRTTRDTGLHRLQDYMGYWTT